MKKNQKVGFMQGRFSTLVDGKIQAFPWDSWREEFLTAVQNDFHLMEWTLDQEGLYKNPLMTEAGQVDIRDLCKQHNFSILSLTGDCFMQSPFWKSQGRERIALENDFLAVATACSSVGITMIVVPLVDNGRIENSEQEDYLVNFLQENSDFLAKNNLQVIFESDFPAPELARFIDRLIPDLFGINYDTGNSAALGFDPTIELAAYGHRIVNVHIKDRVLGGTTVALGEGNTDFTSIFSALSELHYTGNFILQTARATNDNHAETLCRYRDMTLDWLG